MLFSCTEGADVSNGAEIKVPEHRLCLHIISRAVLDLTSNEPEIDKNQVIEWFTGPYESHLFSFPNCCLEVGYEPDAALEALGKKRILTLTQVEEGKKNYLQIDDEPLSDGAVYDEVRRLPSLLRETVPNSLKLPKISGGDYQKKALVPPKSIPDSLKERVDEYKNLLECVRNVHINIFTFPKLPYLTARDFAWASEHIQSPSALTIVYDREPEKSWLKNVTFTNPKVKIVPTRNINDEVAAYIKRPEQLLLFMPEHATSLLKAALLNNKATGLTYWMHKV